MSSAIAIRSAWPAASAAARIVSRAASVPSTSGAKPPSSPTAVTRPRSCRSALRRWKISAPIPSASEKPLGADRRDHELLHVEPVLGVGTAVDHVHQRHGQHAALSPPIQRHSGTPASAAAAFAAASEQPSIAFAPSRPLFSVPSSATRTRRDRAGRSRRHRGARPQRSRTFSTARRHPCRATLRRRRREARPPRSFRSTRPRAPQPARLRPTQGRRPPRRSGFRVSRGSGARRRPRSRSLVVTRPRDGILLFRPVEVAILSGERKIGEGRPVEKSELGRALDSRDEPLRGPP